jgi:PhzF family phenazine biosynthesis protein
MKLKLYQVDAFARQIFEGNPAAVVPLNTWLPDDVLHKIAIENNLSETAFFIPATADEDVDYHIRWFTPVIEVELCGHATLATAHVLFNIIKPKATSLRFMSQSGVLVVHKMADKIVLDFPLRKPLPSGAPSGSVEAIGMASGAVPFEVYRGERDYMFIYEKAEDILNLKPDFSMLKKAGLYGFICTASGGDIEGGYDCVSRFFIPSYGVDEDPVTGSAHCQIAPYWASQLGRNNLFARQASARGGDLWLTVEGDRVKLAGNSVLVIEGAMTI